ncbi:DUF4386 family protein [Propionibacteriaceae bacterium Y1923]
MSVETTIPTAAATVDSIPSHPSSTVPVRTAAIVAGSSLALMAVLAPLGVMVALPAGATGAAALVVLLVAALDVVVGVALYPVVKPGGALLAGTSAALRIAYAAVFAAAAGSLLAPADTARFQAIWDAGLLLFGLHLGVAGLAMVRARTMPTTHPMPTWVGILLVIAGAGYVVDAVTVALTPANPTAFGEFTFIGEVVLLVWLIGWGGRVRAGRVREGVSEA